MRCQQDTRSAGKRSRFRSHGFFSFLCSWKDDCYPWGPKYLSCGPLTQVRKQDVPGSTPAHPAAPHHVLPIKDAFLVSHTFLARPALLQPHIHPVFLSLQLTNLCPAKHSRPRYSCHPRHWQPALNPTGLSNRASCPASSAASTRTHCSSQFCQGQTVVLQCYLLACSPTRRRHERPHRGWASQVSLIVSILCHALDPNRSLQQAQPSRDQCVLPL